MRVSIKGCNEEEFHRLTGARKSAYELPFRALKHLIDAKVSCNACVSVSFSDKQGIAGIKQRLCKIHFGILKSLELERIKLFPKVKKRLAANGLSANRGVSCAGGNNLF